MQTLWRFSRTGHCSVKFPRRFHETNPYVESAQHAWLRRHGEWHLIPQSGDHCSPAVCEPRPGVVGTFVRPKLAARSECLDLISRRRNLTRQFANGEESPDSWMASRLSGMPVASSFLAVPRLPYEYGAFRERWKVHRHRIRAYSEELNHVFFQSVREFNSFTISSNL